MVLKDTLRKNTTIMTRLNQFWKGEFLYELDTDTAHTDSWPRRLYLRHRYEVHICSFTDKSTASKSQY